MKMKSIITALPTGNNTGWGNAGRRITEELQKLAMVTDLNLYDKITKDFPCKFTAPLLHAMRGVDMMPMYQHLDSDHMVAYCFIEDDVLMRKYALNAERYWSVVAVGSTWANQRMVEALGNLDFPPEVVTAIQGVDGDVFCPSEEIKPDPDCFTIFSGGKFEFRKSTDVVIRAVAVMMERHKNVRLVASWWNPWEQTAETLRGSKLIKMARTGHGTMADIRYSALQNGIPEDRLQFVDSIPHDEMPAVMNRCNVGLFPNRCEAGTNLVLMEAMACGMPVIATIAHGHADVTKWLDSPLCLPSDPFPVYRSNGVESMHVADWYEPDLEATIEALEYAYERREYLAETGEHNRAVILNNFTWKNTAQKLLEACTL
jgi:glycosyltransferase involved in cell wall biosynthesis